MDSVLTAKQFGQALPLERQADNPVIISVAQFRPEKVSIYKTNLMSGRYDSFWWLIGPLLITESLCIAFHFRPTASNLRPFQLLLKD